MCPWAGPLVHLPLRKLGQMPHCLPPQVCHKITIQLLLAVDRGRCIGTIFNKMVLVAPAGLKPEEGEIWDYFANSAKGAFERAFYNPAQASEYAQYYGKAWTPEERDSRLLVLRTANAAPVWRGGTHCFCTRSGGKNCIQTSAELY